MYASQHNCVRIQYFSNNEAEPVIIIGLFKREHSYRPSRWISPTNIKKNMSMN